MSAVVTTLCDICENATGFCRWSQKGVQKPVHGWTATRQDGDTGWTVLDCPEKRIPERYRLYYEQFLSEQGISRKAKSEIQRLSDAEIAEAMRLYQAGLNDTSIGKTMGVSQTLIYNWRRRNHLPNNYHLSGWNDRMMPLYGAGLTDDEISRELGCRKSTVRDWRSSHSLPMQGAWTQKYHLRRLVLLEQGLTDEQIAEKEGVLVETIQRWRMGLEYRKLCIAAAEKEPPTA